MNVFFFLVCVHVCVCRVELWDTGVEVDTPSASIGLLCLREAGVSRVKASAFWFESVGVLFMLLSILLSRCLWHVKNARGEGRTPTVSSWIYL